MKYIPTWPFAVFALVLTLTLGACDSAKVQSYVDSVKSVVKDIKVPDALKDIKVPDFIKNIEITPIPDYDPAADEGIN